jgi:type I restriction enzyme, S subunit
MSKWKSVKLDDIAVVMLSNVDKKTNEGERIVKLCNYTDVYKNSYISFDKTESFMIASCNENEFNKFELKRDQVAITKDSEKRDDIGISTYIAEDLENVVLGYHTALITPIENKLSGKFLNYWLNTKLAKEYFENNAGGSGQRCTLPIDIIRAIPIVLPKYDEQLHISSILFNLDIKIDLNNRINAELEQMAKTIYDYWFVQFDFPISAEYATAVGQPELEGKPYKSSGGKMVWSDELKREVPEGWEVKKLEEVVEIKYGKDHKNVGTGLIPVYGSGGIMRYGDRALSEDESILIPRKGTLSNLFYLDKPFWSVDTMFYTKMKVLKSGKYLFYTLERMKLASLNVGTAVPSLTSEVLNKLNLLRPSIDIIVRFDDILAPIFAHRTRNNLENQKLTELRDWLLPMLMNGQVRVCEVEETELLIAAEPQMK